MPNWGEVLKEIQDEIAEKSKLSRSAADTICRSYLEKLSKYTKRNVIAYYSGFLSKPGIQGLEINDEDKNGFMMAVHRLDRTKGLDIILHTPGGNIAATESIVNYLRKMFQDNIRAIVPQIAMSAGTMIACSCREIILSRHSNLGPIDPQLRGVPAAGVIEEFKRAVKEVKKDPSMLPIWLAIIEQYRPTFLSQCENAVAWSKEFVRDQLRCVMFKNDSKRVEKARAIVHALTQYRKNRTHERHLHYEDCKDIGLCVTELESDRELQDLVLTVHHCFMHILMNTNSFKIIENHLGTAFVKQQVVVSVPAGQ